MEEAPVSVNNPHEASDLGIQIVYQDLALCENLDVAANLSLGVEPVKSGWPFLPRMLRPLDDLEMEVRAQDAIDRLQVRTSAICARQGRRSVGGATSGDCDCARCRRRRIGRDAG